MLGFIQDYVNPKDYLWQLPLVLAFMAGWLLAGPYLLRRSVRKHTPRPKLKFSNYVLTCLLAGCGAFFLGGILAFTLGTVGQHMERDLRIPAAVAGLLLAVATAYLIVYAMLNLTVRQAVKVGTPALGAIFGLVLIVGASCVVPAISIRRDRTAYESCYKNLYAVDKAIREYETVLNHGQPPETLDKLFDPSLKNRLEPNGIVCTRGGTLFYYSQVRSMTRTASSQTKKLRICDLRSNHKAGRNWLYADGTPDHNTEQEFQKVLLLPENADFARALQAVDK